MEQPQYDLPPADLIVVLDPPIARKDGGSVTELVLHEPTAAQVRTAESHLRSGVNPESYRNYQLSLVTSVSGVARTVIDSLPVTKLTEAHDYLQGFITPPPRIGQS